MGSLNQRTGFYKHVVVCVIDELVSVLPETAYPPGGLLFVEPTPRREGDEGEGAY